MNNVDPDEANKVFTAEITSKPFNYFIFIKFLPFYLSSIENTNKHIF